MAGNPYITPALFRFFEDLKKDNTREWINANKDRYEEVVRGPLLRFIGDFEPRLSRISRHLLADTRKTGKSLFRLYRDTRFSEDKSPCKEHAGIHFPHKAGQDAHAPGFYLHLAPEEVFAGAGTWRPDAPALRRIRQAIVARPAEWAAIRSNKAFAANWDMWTDDTLVRPPMGFPADHPHLADIKMKSFTALHSFTRREVTAGDFPDRFAAVCAAAEPLMRFLTKALGVAW